MTGTQRFEIEELRYNLLNGPLQGTQRALDLLEWNLNRCDHRTPEGWAFVPMGLTCPVCLRPSPIDDKAEEARIVEHSRMKHLAKLAKKQGRVGI